MLYYTRVACFRIFSRALVSTTKSCQQRRILPCAFSRKAEPSVGSLSAVRWITSRRSYSTKKEDEGSDVPLSDVPKPALWLGCLGALPFAASTFLISFPGFPPSTMTLALEAQLYYGASILSFLGAVQWGLAAAEFKAPGVDLSPGVVAGITFPRLIYSVTPSLIAWVSLMAYKSNPALSFSALVFGFMLALAYDLKTIGQGLAPAWYQKLRILLSSAVIIMLSSSAYVILSQAPPKK
mmetsp:Transcript_25098/g.41343  ORF Transcript_25098/g.41343 Transcript_25098/m.41343 type:complete len:238 (-) Transcript_25098:473-1186(-)